MNRLRRALLRLAALVALAPILPRWWCGRGADDLFRDAPDAQIPLADAVAHDVGAGVSTASFHTGSDHFNGEWTLVTHQMSVLGMVQVVRAHPSLRSRYLQPIRHAADQMLREDSLRFGAIAWGEPGLATLDSPHGHAYLGYLNLALSALREVDPATPHAALNDRLTEALARRIAASPTGMIETFPNQTYPPDVTSVIGSIGLHDRLTGSDHRAVLATWERRFRGAYVEAARGMVIQCARDDGSPGGPPRGSGTAISAYFLSFALPDLARDLARGLLHHGARSVLGFGGVREYPDGVPGDGDIDSGPLLFGMGVSATGFGLASARLASDGDAFTRIYRTTVLFGAPVSQHGERWASGGPIGNAVLLAMLTARRP